MDNISSVKSINFSNSINNSGSLYNGYKGYSSLNYDNGSMTTMNLDLSPKAFVESGATIINVGSSILKGTLEAVEAGADFALEVVGCPLVYGTSLVSDAVNGTNNADNNLHNFQNFIASSIADEAYNSFYSTSSAKTIDSYSAIKHDSALSNNISNVSKIASEAIMVVGASLVSGVGAGAASSFILTAGDSYNKTYKSLSDNGNNNLSSSQQLDLYSRTAIKGGIASLVTILGGKLGKLSDSIFVKPLTKIGMTGVIGSSMGSLAWGGNTLTDYSYGDKNAIETNGGLQGLATYAATGFALGGASKMFKFAIDKNANGSVAENTDENVIIYDVNENETPTIETISSNNSFSSTATTTANAVPQSSSDVNSDVNNTVNLQKGAVDAASDSIKNTVRTEEKKNHKKSKVTSKSKGGKK